MTQTARSLAIPYEAARDRFVRAFREAETSGESIRLAKRTTNLFRPRRSLAARRIPVDGLDRVFDVDVDAKAARVGGMTDYRTFTDATLPCGLMPAVVPELRSITVGGALTGIGIESSSWLHGLVHEAVDEIEILTGSGEVLVADRNGPHADLFFGFPNSYGTLGYALSVRVRLQEVSPCVRLMHVRFSSPDDLFTALADICDSGVHDETPVDFVDGSVFAADEAYLSLGSFVDDPDCGPPSDYTWMRIYHRSIRERSADLLTTQGYLWRWDTDWFWCSGNLGFERPCVRALAGPELLRSTTYRRILSLEHRWQITRRIRAIRREPRREAVIQDVEIPIGRAGDFLRFFHDEIGILPIWICPTRAQPESDRFPLYSMRPDELYVNFGFWSSVELEPGMDESHHNRRIEAAVEELGGRKSLYSTAFYDRETFDRIYNAEEYERLKVSYDPKGRLPSLYAKTVDRV